MSGADRELASRLGKFLVVGGTGLVVNNAALHAFYQMLRLPLVLASTLAVALAIGNNFALNELWTFKHYHDTAWLGRLVRFGLVSLVGLAVATVTLWVLVTFLEVHYLLANLAGAGMATGSNFIANMKWTWSRSERQ
jgi:dolichol-phosphate mannosyltransferase